MTADFSELYSVKYEYHLPVFYQEPNFSIKIISTPQMRMRADTSRFSLLECESIRSHWAQLTSFNSLTPLSDPTYATDGSYDIATPFHLHNVVTHIRGRLGALSTRH
jgi:hypothetical protein